MSYRQDWIAYIAKRAPAYGLDPHAVLAVAASEGLSGAVGDQGTSYGPFQLHRGGALPAGRDRTWAESPEGIDYALSQMAGIAKGLKGRQAISNIVTRFERPADPQGEIGRASGYYGSVSGGRNAPVAAQEPPGAVAAPGGYSPRTTALNALQQLATGSYNPISTLRDIAAQKQQFHEIPGTGLTLAAPKHATRTAAKAVNLVQQYMGTPYVWGGESPKGFDCSGLLQYVWSKVGVEIPRTSQTQWHYGTPISPKALQPGDAVFFGSTKGPHHVGMYMGGGKFIESPYTGQVVRISELAGRKDFIGARRFA